MLSLILLFHLSFLFSLVTFLFPLSSATITGAPILANAVLMRELHPPYTYIFMATKYWKPLKRFQLATLSR